MARFSWSRYESRVWNTAPAFASDIRASATASSRRSAQLIPRPRPALDDSNLVIPGARVRPASCHPHARGRHGRDGMLRNHMSSRLRSAVTAAALGMAAWRTAAAQATLRSVGNDFADGAKDIVHIWTAPIRADGGDWAKAAAAGGAFAVTAVFDERIDR